MTAHTTAGQQTSNVNAVLQVGAEISGTIKNTGGNPVSGICIEVDSNNAAADYGGFDNGGTYVINQLSAGTYQVGFTGGCGNTGSYAPNWYSGQPSENTATPITLTTGENFTARRGNAAGRDNHREGHQHPRERRSTGSVLTPCRSSMPNSASWPSNRRPLPDMAPIRCPTSRRVSI